MPIADALIAEVDVEMATTGRLLRCVPEQKTSFRPHPKSWTLGELGMHIANLPTWAVSVLRDTELDIAPPGGPTWAPRKFESARVTLSTFEANVPPFRDALAKASDADLAVPWSMKKGGAVVFSHPRITLLRSFVLNHLIHHRGQMTIYLRLCDVPLPPVYGPTADAPM